MLWLHELDGVADHRDGCGASDPARGDRPLRRRRCPGGGDGDRALGRRHRAGVGRRVVRRCAPRWRRGPSCDGTLAHDVVAVGSLVPRKGAEHLVALTALLRADLRPSACVDRRTPRQPLRRPRPLRSRRSGPGGCTRSGGPGRRRRPVVAHRRCRGAPGPGGSRPARGDRGRAARHPGGDLGHRRRRRPRAVGRPRPPGRGRRRPGRRVRGGRRPALRSGRPCAAGVALEAACAARTTDRLAPALLDASREVRRERQPAHRLGHGARPRPHWRADRLGRLATWPATGEAVDLSVSHATTDRCGPRWSVPASRSSPSSPGFGPFPAATVAAGGRTWDARAPAGGAAGAAWRRRIRASPRPTRCWSRARAPGRCRGPPAAGRTEGGRPPPRARGRTRPQHRRRLDPRTGLRRSGPGGGRTGRRPGPVGRRPRRPDHDHPGHRRARLGGPPVRADRVRGRGRVAQGHDRAIAAAHVLRRGTRRCGGTGSGGDPTRLGVRRRRRPPGPASRAGADPWAVVEAPAALVVPSREDPLPLVALEAGARCIPVVACRRSGGLDDLLADGRGWLVDPTDPRDLAATVAEVAGSRPTADPVPCGTTSRATTRSTWWARAGSTPSARRPEPGRDDGRPKAPIVGFVDRCPRGAAIRRSGS